LRERNYVGRGRRDVVGITAPSILPEVCRFLLIVGKLLCVNGVEMEIAGYLTQIAVGINEECLAPPLVEMTDVRCFLLK
jgi:hypothetical protein